MVNLVGIGGGTGLSVLLRGIKGLSETSEPGHAAGLNISAIVCVSDNGGSSGRLRQNFGIPAVGDLRNCLVALSDGDPKLAELFQHRFSGGNGFNGHSLGNLIVTALFQMSGNLGRAIGLAGEVLQSRGCVFPVTESPSTLCAEMESGNVIRGESQITAALDRIKRVWLEPESPPPSPGAIQALSSADAIILGPGSLYTSIIPNLLVQGVAETLQKSKALKIFVCNLMTQPGETDGFTAADHLQALKNYLRSGVDVCLLNSSPIKQTLEDAYLESKSVPVAWDEEAVAGMGVATFCGDLLAEERLRIRHDPYKLARLILSLTRGIHPPLCNSELTRELPHRVKA